MAVRRAGVRPGGLHGAGAGVVRADGGGAAAGRAVEGVGWTGGELVAFRLHIPSEIPFHNAPSRQVQRGNILEWEQPFAARRAGEALDIEVHMEPESILYSTLILFGGTVVAALLTFVVVIWWVMRRGRDADADTHAAGSRS